MAVVVAPSFVSLFPAFGFFSTALTTIPLLDLRHSRYLKVKGGWVRSVFLLSRFLLSRMLTVTKMMGEMAVGGESARIAPVTEDTVEVANRAESKPQQEFVIIVSETKPPRNIEQDSWLPITESKKGNTFTVAFHLICSGIGVQPLLLPIAFASLGWFGGILCLSVVFCWQLYEIWLLLNLHESASGIRYSRFLHLSIVAFGQKLGKLVAIFPTMYLSTGTCVLYIISGGNIMDQLHHALCGNYPECEAKMLKLSEWFLVFICLATFTALFFTNLNKLHRVSLVGSITAFAYCSLLWVLSVSKGELVVFH